MNEASKQAVLSAVRSFLIAVGAWLATRGYFDEETLNNAVGGIMVIVPLIWGIWDKFMSEQKTAAREVVAVNVGIIKADNTVGVTPLETKESAPDTIEAIAPAVPQLQPRRNEL